MYDWIDIQIKNIHMMIYSYKRLFMQMNDEKILR